MATDFVFPEDSGTGATGGDNADAANFATLAHATGFVDYVETGLTVTLDAATPAFDLSAGMCVVTDASAQEAQTSEVRDQGVSYSAILSQRTGVALTDNDVNHVYVQVDLSTDDTIDVVVNTTGSKPTEPSLKIAEIDTSNDTVTPWNRTKDATDVYATKSDVPKLSEGEWVWVQDEERYYYEDGN